MELARVLKDENSPDKLLYLFLIIFFRIEGKRVSDFMLTLNSTMSHGHLVCFKDL